jgi:hypothetical protein
MTSPARPALMSEEYRRLQEELHGDPSYGVASVAYAPIVADFIRRNKVKEVLDYGAGKGRLGEELDWLVPWPLEMRRYDPGVPQYAAPPAPAELVACVDVLEHVEPDLLPNVLDDLKRVTAAHGFFTVHTDPAMKVLADGRNAHLIQQPARWWLPRLMERFELVHFSQMPHGFWTIVRKAA